MMADESKLRVLLADDHAGVLAALQRLLEPSYRVVGTVMHGEALLQAAARLAPDVVVLDVVLSDVSGLDLCRQIKQRLPGAKVIMLSAASDRVAIEEAFRVGASAFVAKNLAGEHLVPAIQQAMRGGTYCSSL